MLGPKLNHALTHHLAKETEEILANNDTKALAKQYNAALVERDLSRTLSDPLWVQLAASHWKVASHIENKELPLAFTEQTTTLMMLNRVAERCESWILRAIYRVVRDLLWLAKEVDKITKPERSEESESATEIASRTVNRSLTICLNDRASELDVSKKWGVYFLVGQLLKAYFAVNKRSLAQTVLKVVQAMQSELPPLDDYPWASRLPVLYYSGVLSVMNEQYQEAYDRLQQALQLCPTTQTYQGNRHKIYMYLIPLTLHLTSRSPSQVLYDQFPDLAAIYKSLVTAVNQGQVDRFDKLVAQQRRVLVAKYGYVLVQRLRMLAVYNAFYRTVKCLENATRVPVESLVAGLRVVGFFEGDDDFEDQMDETEALVAVFIGRGMIKGYVSHERRMVVLSNVDAFKRTN